MSVARTRCRLLLRPQLVAWLLALPLVPAAHATVYKCAGEGGSIVYQEAPCAKGKELRNFDTDPPEISVVPAYTGPPPRTDVPATAAAAKPPRDTRTLNADVAPGKATGDASARKFVRQGMSEAEVLARLGRPDATAGGNKQHQARWSYLPTDGDPDTVTTITFSGGMVSDVSRKVVRR